MGLGKADAIVLAREGGRVVLTDVNTEGEHTAREIGGETMFVHHDVRDEDQWRSLIATVADRFGGLDVLVNNAGVIHVDDIETADLDRWRFVNSVNVEGTFLGCKHTIPAMRAERGRINHQRVVDGGDPRLPSSACLHRVEGCGAGSHPVDRSPLHDPRRPNPMQRHLPHLAESPMSRAHGGTTALASPFGVANAVLFLASDESSDLNGTFLNLDRGAACLVGELPDTST